MTTTMIKPTVTRAEKGNSRWYGPSLMSHVVPSEATGGALTVVQFYGPQGGEPPLHKHSRDDEFFYVLEGEGTYECNGEKLRARAGSLVWFPCHTEHGFKFDTPTAKALVGVMPGDFEKWFITFSKPAESMSLPPSDNAFYREDIPRMMEMAGQLGVEFLPPHVTATTPSDKPASCGFTSHRDQVEPLRFPNMTMRFLCGSDATNGALTVLENELHVGASIPLHTKKDFEVSLVLEGQTRFQLGDQAVDAGPGEFIMSPPGSPFGYRNTGSEPCRLIHFIFGGTFDKFARELLSLMGDPSTTWETVCNLLERHRMTAIAPQIAL